MPPGKEDAVRLEDMADAARGVLRIVAGVTYDVYEQDQALRWSVERGIEIVGEAARGVSRELQAQHSEIPWRFIVAQRNVIAHDYGDILDERIWRVATVGLPELLIQLDRLLSSDE